MGGYLEYVRKELKPNLTAIKDDLERRKDKSFFWITGTQVYCGMQGSGKTISAVKHVLDIKKEYPQAVLVSNLNLAYFEPIHVKGRLTDPMTDPKIQYYLFGDIDSLSWALTNINNGTKGVIYLIDEIHTYFNALDSKNVPIWIFTEISQQRKQRKTIIGTSQLFQRMAKPFREQCDSLIMCNTYFGYLTTQTAYMGDELDENSKGDLTGKVKKRGFFIQSRYVRNAFDTYQKVVSGNVQFENRPALVIDRKKIRVL